MRAAHVVNATGVWADQLRPQELHDEAELPQIRPSRGTHILLRNAELPLRGGAIVPAGGGRTIFALPWLGHALVGTTDNDYEGDLEHVQPRRPTTSTTCWRPSTTSSAPSSGRGDLTGAFAGVRPLISTSDSKSSVDISRKAELYETSSGMITITGGKLTTWRRMAKMAVDRLVERDARDAPCRTHEIPLGQAVPDDSCPRARGSTSAAYPALAGRYGYAASDVLALAAEPAASWPSRSSRACPTCSPRSRSRRAASRPRSIGDVLLRRTRLGLLAGRELGQGEDGGPPAPARRAGDVLARELGWDQQRLELELERFEQEARAEGVVPSCWQEHASPEREPTSTAHAL